MKKQPRLQLHKCPQCKKNTYVVSIFGSICSNCMYEPSPKLGKDSVRTLFTKEEVTGMLEGQKKDLTTEFERRLEEYRNSPEVWKHVGISKWRNWGRRCGYFDYLSNK